MEQIPIDVLYRTTSNEKNIILISAFVSIIILIFVRNSYQKSISSLFLIIIKSFFSYKKTKTKESNSSHKSNVASFLLFLIFLISTTSIIFSYFSYFNPIEISYQDFDLYLFILISTISYLFLKITVISGIGLILKIQEVTNKYLEIIFNYFNILGITLIPIFLLIPFFETNIQFYLICLSFIIFAILFILRIIISFIISFKEKFPIQYTILYFCIFEFFPPLIIVDYLYDVL